MPVRVYCALDHAEWSRLWGEPMRIKTTLLAAVVAAGVVAGLGPVTATAEAGTPVVHVAPTAQKTRAAGGGGAGRDFTGDGRPDVIARSATSGGLYLYPHSGSFNGTRTYSAARLLDSGWGSMRWIGAADLSGDGLADVVSIDSAGVMRVAVNLGGRLAANRVINHGWDINDLVIVTDYNGDGYDDLMGRPGLHREFNIYYNNGGVTPTTTFAPPQVAISGVSPVIAMFADFTRDGVPDMLYTVQSGNMYVYDLAGNRIVLANRGWYTMDQLSATDVNGDGAPDLLSRDVYTGELYASPHSGSFYLDSNGWAMSMLRDKVLVGTGWNMHDLIT